MLELTVGLDERSYPILIGAGELISLNTALAGVRFPRRVAVITNPTVGPLYADQVCTLLRDGGREVRVIQIPDGEHYKTMATVEEVLDTLVDWSFDRSCGLIALGGGVIGDLTGFVAAIYLRGIPFVQLPTTLLAQVDSSVGGKTGVNHPQGKNLIGAFYQPRHVLIDVNVLKTLAPREYAAGLAEVVKYGVIRDAGFFSWLEENSRALLARSPQALEYAIGVACRLKAEVVASDEREEGVRALLNYGHTFGHAVETLCGYGVVLHGEAVAIGMVLAARAAVTLGFADCAEVARLVALLQAFDLPVTPPDFSVAEYVAVMRHDKKVRDGALRFVLNHGIGHAELHRIDDPEALLTALLPGREQ